MKWNALKYLLPFVFFFLAYFAMHGVGWVVFLPLLAAFVVIPIVELLFKPNPANLSDAEEAMAKADPVYDWILYLVVPLQYTTLYWFITGITDTSLQWWEVVGRSASMGLMCGTFGINVAHELGHRSTRHEQWMAKALLLTSLYTHFFIEHNKGHHKHVSTPGDPSSAPYRQWLFMFWIRSISGVYAGAWRIANEEMRKKGLPALHWKNEMLQLQMLTVLVMLGMGWWFGAMATLLFAAAALGGIALLETVNYIEHYGLSRNETAPGKYERAMPWHSWNSNHVLGRIMLFELSRHSDHHYLASRKYQILRHHDDAPQLPTGYPGSMILALVPPLWFAVMDRQMQRYGIKPHTVTFGQALFGWMAAKENAGTSKAFTA